MEEKTQGILNLNQFSEALTGIVGNSHKIWTMRVTGFTVEICDTPSGSYRISLYDINKELLRSREHKYGKRPKTKTTAMNKALKTATKYYNLVKAKGDSLKPSPKVKSDQTNKPFESIRTENNTNGRIYSQEKQEEREPEVYKPKVKINGKDLFVWEMNVYFSSTEEVWTSHILAKDLKTALNKAEHEIPEDNNVDKLVIELAHEIII